MGAAVVAIVKLADPSNVAVPVTAPVRATVRAVNNRDAVVAFPLTLPVNVAVITLAEKLPLESRATIEFPVLPELAAAGAVPRATQVIGEALVRIQNVFVLISQATLPQSVDASVVIAPRAAELENSHL